MGYRLFVKGIWGHAGEMEAEFGDNKLILKKAAPGTFFALFGAIIVAITIYKGLEFENHVNAEETQSYIEVIKENIDDIPKKPPF